MCSLHYEKFPDGSVKCIEEEIPFAIPQGWEWARIYNIAYFQGGYAYKSNKYIAKSNNLVVRIGNVKNDKILTNVSPVFIDEQYAEETESYRILEDDILFTMTGTKGKRDYFYSCVINHFDIDKCSLYLNQRVGCLRLVDSNCINPNLLSIFLKSSFILDSIFSTETGNVNQGNIGSNSTLNLLIPIPTVSAQNKLLKSVHTAFELCSTVDSDKTSLQGLINQTKSKILDLAIRGKLVPQDPNDEPASVLLERIRAEKENLIKQGKIKRDKKESVIFRGEDNSYYRISSYNKSYREQLYELPANWSICTLPDIAKIDLGKTLDTSKNTGKPHSYLRSVNVRWCNIDLSDLKEMLIEDEELERYSVQKNDLLICEGGDVGRSCVWTSNETICYQNALHRVRLYDKCNPFFFMYYMMHYESKGIIKDMCKGVTIKHLTGNVLSTIPFSLPPVSEQNRIVNAIESAFAQLDEIANAIA